MKLMADNRKLIPLEQVMEVYNRRAGAYNVVTISRIQGHLKQEIIRQSLDIIQCRHPRLNSRIVGELDSLQFETEGTQKIPLRVVTNVQSEQWNDVVLSELNEKIDSSRCLIRSVFVCPNDENSVSYLITTIHHAIIDGLSSIRLHSELLTYCQKLVEGEQITKIDSLPALPSLEELLPESMKGIKGKIKGVLFLFKLKFQLIWNQPKTMDFEKCVPISLRYCGFVRRQLDETLTQQLANLCRQKNATMQGALCAALMLVVFPKIAGSKKTDVIRVSCRSYVDLRKRLKPIVSDEPLGVLASSLTSFHSIRKSTSFWDLAQDVTQQLKVGLERDDIFSTVLMGKKIFESLISRPNKVPVTVVITNVGRVNIPTGYGSFKLEEISYVPALAVFGGMLSAAVITFQEKMLLNFIFSEPSISRDTIEILANNVLSCLVDACKKED